MDCKIKKVSLEILEPLFKMGRFSQMKDANFDIGACSEEEQMDVNYE